MTFRCWTISVCLLCVSPLAGLGAELPPLFAKNRPAWEIKFSDTSNAVMSVMPGESKKTFYDPLIKKNVRWEQDVYCPAFIVFNGKLYCVYRAFGDDEEWRFGLAWSEDGLHFTRSDKPLLYAKPSDTFLGALRDAKGKGVSYGDPHIMADEKGNFYLYFGFFHFGNTTNDQQLAVATSRDLLDWTVHGRIFTGQAASDRAVIPERSPWRLLNATVVSRLEGDRFVAARIQGKYWAYFNCYATKGPYCLCVATSENLLDWKVLRDEQGTLVNPLPTRPGYFDSWYTDPVAAVLCDDGILLIYNGVNADGSRGDTRLKYYAHYPAQALFEQKRSHAAFARSDSPFKGGDLELEKKPIVFWCAPLYESWSLVPFKGELLLYWNHAFGRRSVGLWKAPIPASMSRSGVTIESQKDKVGLTGR